MEMQLIYVDGTSCDTMNVVRHRPAIRSWSCDSLKRRENLEIADGGFGLGDLLPAYELTSIEDDDLSDEEHLT